jgi:hypothetical protein
MMVMQQPIQDSVGVCGARRCERNEPTQDDEFPHCGLLLVWREAISDSGQAWLIYR